MFKSKRTLGVVLSVTLLAALTVWPRISANLYVLHLLILLFFAVAMGESWNLIGGFGGQYSLGHAAYFGVGAYGTALLFQHAQIPPWYGAWIAMLLAMVLALVTGTLCFRLRGPYFVLASIAVAEIVRLLALEWKDLTNGAEGILLGDLPPLKVGPWVVTNFSSKEPIYYLSLGLALLTLLACLATRHSKLGYYLQAIREDQDAAHSLGIPIGRYKNYALIASAALTSLVGSLFAFDVYFVSPPTVLGIDISIQAVLVCIVGGVGTVAGPAVGAVVMVLLSEALRTNLLTQGLVAVGLVLPESPVGQFLRENLAHAHALIYGFLMILVVLFMPEGVVALARSRVSGRGTKAVSREAPYAHS